MKEPYFVIFVKGIRRRKPPHCVSSLLDSFGPSNCLNVILSCIIYHNRFCGVFFFFLFEFAQSLSHSFSIMVEIRGEKAWLFYKYNPVCNRTLSKIFYLFIFSYSQTLPRVNGMLSREVTAVFFFNFDFGKAQE